MPGWKDLEKELEGVASDSYFLSPSMIKFLLVENLAIKTYLHEKGLMNPEEYKEHQKKAAEVLDIKIKGDLKSHLKQVAEKLREDSRELSNNQIDHPVVPDDLADEL